MPEITQIEKHPLDQTKLLVLLQSLDATDLRQLDAFVRSPYHNTNKDCIRLYKVLYTYLRKLQAGRKATLTHAKLWKKLYGQKPYDDPFMRRLFNALLTLVYAYLAHSALEEQDVRLNYQLLHKLNTRSTDKHFTGVLRKIRALQEQSPERSAEYHYNHFRIEFDCFEHLERLSQKSIDLLNLRKADYHLDCFYILCKLRHYCELLMYQSVRKIDVELNFIPGFLETFQQSEYLDVPAIHIYYKVIQAFLYKENEQFYQELIQQLEEHREAFDKSELRQVFLYAQNYCAYKINLGNLKYYKELFRIYQLFIERDLLLNNGEIAAGNYKNIITVGLMIKEFDWVEQFIQDFTPHLPEANQDNDLNYNLAKVYFHQEDYPRVIEQLREVEYKNLNYALGGKLMLLKTYFELEEVQSLESLIESFRIYLLRNKLISRDVRQQYSNVLRFTRKLFNLAPYDQEGLEKVKTQIEQCKALAAKKWLLEKVEERSK